jgi:hypothetical protein
MARNTRAVALGDHVTILPLGSHGATIKAQTAVVVYAGPVYIRLSDGSVYATSGLAAVQGNENTRIEAIAR